MCAFHYSFQRKTYLHPSIRADIRIFSPLHPSFLKQILNLQLILIEVGVRSTAEHRKQFNQETREISRWMDMVSICL